MEDKFKNVLCYDIETRVFGKPDPDKDRLRIFGCYSYKTGKYYLLSDKEQIQKVVNSHKFLVGFNNENYDNPILQREGINLKYKTIIDLRKIFKMRAGAMQIKKGMLGDLIMSYSLDFITKLLGIVDDEEGKMKIDYKLFEKETWSKEELELISKYTKRDIEVTKKLYEWVEDYFDSFKDFIHDVDIEKKTYLTATIAKFAYKAICKAMNWTEEYGDIGGSEGSIKGGYVAYPAGEKFEGDIYCLDFNCLTKDTKIKMWRDCLQFYDKPISEIKSGDYIVNQEGKQEVDMVTTQEYDDEVIEIVLENNNKLVCTPQHILPVYRDGNTIDIKAEDILDSDELFTRHSKRGKLNGHFKGGQINKVCKVCSKEFFVFPSQNYIQCCSSNCSNVLRSVNNPKTNLGKNKENCEHFKRMSLERKGKKRPTHIKKNIAEGNRLATQNGFNGGKYFYKGVYFKSKYELKVAKSLDRDNIEWSYEPQVFTLPSGEVYTPDFYLPKLDKWLEVKGCLILDTKNSSYRKFKEFVKENPNSVIINEENVEQLKAIVNG